jgi:Asp-tRNA(Asn)/Glu-tRNA(Gln) amidotransferase A subunit family amidase
LLAIDLQGAFPAGLPMALQLVGKQLGEELLCKLGHAYEGAVGRQRNPMVAPSLRQEKIAAATKL